MERSLKFYQKLDEILRHRPASAPAVVRHAGSSTVTASETDTEEGDSEEGEMHGEE